MAGQHFEFGPPGNDFNEAWRKERNDFNKKNPEGNDHPNLFTNRLGATAGFNSSDLHCAKSQARRKASLSTRFFSAEADSDSSDGGNTLQAQEYLWVTVPSRYEHRDARDPRSLSSRPPGGAEIRQRNTSGAPQIEPPPHALFELRIAPFSGSTPHYRYHLIAACSNLMPRQLAES